MRQFIIDLKKGTISLEEARVKAQEFLDSGRKLTVRQKDLLQRLLNSKSIGLSLIFSGYQDSFKRKPVKDWGKIADDVIENIPHRSSLIAGGLILPKCNHCGKDPHAPRVPTLRPGRNRRH